MLVCVKDAKLSSSVIEQDAKLRSSVIEQVANICSSVIVGPSPMKKHHFRIETHRDEGDGLTRKLKIGFTCAIRGKPLGSICADPL